MKRILLLVFLLNIGFGFAADDDHDFSASYFFSGIDYSITNSKGKLLNSNSSKDEYADLSISYLELPFKAETFESGGFPEYYLVDMSALGWLFTALYEVSSDEDGIENLDKKRPIRYFYRQQLGWEVVKISEHPLIMSLDLGGLMTPTGGGFNAGFAFKYLYMLEDGFFVSPNLSIGALLNNGVVGPVFEIGIDAKYYLASWVGISLEYRHTQISYKEENDTISESKDAFGAAFFLATDFWGLLDL